MGAVIECKWAHVNLEGIENILKLDDGDGCTTLHLRKKLNYMLRGDEFYGL